MTRHRNLLSHREKIRHRKEWLASCTVVLFIVGLAGCERSQRMSQPLFPSLASATSSWDMPAAHKTDDAAAATAQHQTRKRTTIGQRETTQATATPRKLTTAAKQESETAAAKAEPAVEPAATQAETTAAEPEAKIQTVSTVAMLAPDAIEAEPDSASPSPGPGDQAAIEKLASRIAKELSVICPMTDPADQAAFEACKQAMYQGSRLRDALSPVTLWGRQHKDPKTPLGETGFTQFSPDVLTGMYIPLFMFSGSSTVTWSEAEKLYRVELGAAFRNRLKPGQFPYPFWHNDEKWSVYQRANGILLWIDAGSKKVKLAQFTPRGAERSEVVIVPYDMPKFDGKWMWTDDKGVQQPKVTLFDGLFRKDNPYLKKIDTSYKELANSLREGECATCHQPGNPAKSKRLVLLQTPAHAAGEVKRLIKAVEAGQMPLDETSRMPKALDANVKAALLARAKDFDALIEKAKAWEQGKAEKMAAANP